jgi:DNA repair ATPase RecN
LGSDWFLERTETLYEQVMEITKAVKQILENRGEALQDYFKELEGSCRRVAELIEQIGAARLMLRKMRERKEFTIGKLLKKKRVIKDKLQLLKNVKNKNEAAFLDITNIDQAFVT